MKKLATMPPRAGRATVHDWDTWSDGGVYEIKQGVDFQGAVESMRTQLYGKARSMGKAVEVVTDREKGTISFRMFAKPASD